MEGLLKDPNMGVNELMRLIRYARCVAPHFTLALTMRSSKHVRRLRRDLYVRMIEDEDTKLGRIQMRAKVSVKGLGHFIPYPQLSTSSPAVSVKSDCVVHVLNRLQRLKTMLLNLRY